MLIENLKPCNQFIALKKSPRLDEVERAFWVALRSYVSRKESIPEVDAETVVDLTLMGGGVQRDPTNHVRPGVFKGLPTLRIRNQQNRSIRSNNSSSQGAPDITARLHRAGRYV
jgi:hypothetical protein